MKTILIHSIGTALPGVTKILADAFEVNHQLITQMIYNAPSVFLHKVDEETAIKAEELLTKLGLEVIVKDSEDSIPSPSEKLDIALYIHEPLKIHHIAKQLSEFLGIPKKDALNLILQDPSVVLGGVSYNTAKAFEKRIDAEVMLSNPLKATYTIVIKDFTPTFISEFKALCKNDEHIIKDHKLCGLSYSQAQKLWNNVQDAKKIKLINEDFTRYKVILNDFDKQNFSSVKFLKEEVGMPKDFIFQLGKHLPVVLEESISKYKLETYLNLTKKAGLGCIAHAVSTNKYKLQVQNITNKKKVEETLEFFFKKVEIKDNQRQTPERLDDVLNRLLSLQLEALGCEVEPLYI